MPVQTLLKRSRTARSGDLTAGRERDVLCESGLIMRAEANPTPRCHARLPLRAFVPSCLRAFVT